jgi:glycine/D-amino acid oxidase-like deaminating enzyme/nitrite reductase/ring-hydroxylating ferredoxin subunit
MDKILSVFEDNTPRKIYPSPEGNLSADVAVVGGGITGITAAYLLAQRGKSVVVLEAMSIGKGATGNSTGNLYATVGNQGLQSIRSKFGDETLRSVVAARAAAVDLIEKQVNELGIDCDFRRVTWNLFTETEQNGSYIAGEKDAARQAGLTVTEKSFFPFDARLGFNLEDQAQFNPYLYVTGLAEKTNGDNSRIFEYTKVTGIEEKEDSLVVHTAGGTVTASSVIMATHTPIGVYNVHFLLGAYREYAVAATLNGDYPPDGIYWNLQQTEHYSLRTYESAKGKVLMLLGETHKVGQKENNAECFEQLEAFLRGRFDVETVKYRWAAQQYRPADDLPYIGRTSGRSGIYIATGFSADGLTYGTLAAMILTDLITGADNKWASLFDPRRHTPLASAKNFLKETIDVAAQYIKDFPYIAEADTWSDIASGEGKTIDVKGEKYGAYRDEHGQLHVVSAVCTHMKCIVNWNTSEKSWDCPCHGSRFTFDGKVIEGPAISDLPRMSNELNE